MESELEKAERLQHFYDGIEGPLWLHMLGYADWEVEKYLIKKEQMQIIDCVECGYTNESATAICSRIGCPLMDKPSPFTFPFSNGRRPVIESERVQEVMDEKLEEEVQIDTSRQEEKER